MRLVHMKRVRACQHAEGPGHDCEYVDWRNSLLDAAEARADQLCGAEPRQHKDISAAEADPETASWAARWNFAFHNEMAQLTADPFRRGGRGGDLLGGVEVEYPEAPDEGGETVH